MSITRIPLTRVHVGFHKVRIENGLTRIIIQTRHKQASIHTKFDTKIQESHFMDSKPFGSSSDCNHSCSVRCRKTDVASTFR